MAASFSQRMRMAPQRFLRRSESYTIQGRARKPASRYARGYGRVVFGGDLNSHGVGRLAREAGYAWPTEHGPRTTRFGRWAHVFCRGLASPDSAAAGPVLDIRGRPGAADERRDELMARITDEYAKSEGNEAAQDAAREHAVHKGDAGSVSLIVRLGPPPFTGLLADGLDALGSPGEL